jgi:hypothetical protein
VDTEFDPIILKYEGLEASRHLIDLRQVGISIQGASQILGSVGHLVVTGQYAKRTHALSVRVLASTPRNGSWELPAVIMTAAPMMIPMLPTFAEISKKAATSAATRIFNYVIAKLGGHQSEAKMAFDLAKNALDQMGQTSRHAIDAVERIATHQRPAARLFVVPIGQSCSHVLVGGPRDGAIPIDKPMRDAIDAPDPTDIGPTQTFQIFITELDLKNRTCKFSFFDDLDALGNEPRFNGEIIDPILHTPNNPYSAALASQQVIEVVAKPELRDGEIEKLYISDVRARALLTSA